MLGVVGLSWLVWGWLSPGGFPLGHPRFWINRAAPLSVSVLAIVALVLLRMRIRSPAALVLTWAAAASLGAGAMAYLLLPVSGARAALPCLALALLLGAPLPGLVRRARVRRGRALASALLGAVLGACLPASQLSLVAGTRPLVDVAAVDSLVALGPGVGGGSRPRLQVESGGLRLQVDPLVTFSSRSPDATWTVFAPLAARTGPAWGLHSAWTDGAWSSQAFVAGEERALLRHRTGPGLLLVDALSALPRPVHSHLNSYTAVLVHLDPTDRLRLSFSPCPETLVEVQQSDYPVGRPARLAYLDGEGSFRVVEASSGEKGPFRLLAEGPLAAGEPLTVTLVLGDRPACRIVWDDWSAQASPRLSPTAGWGVAENALEFSRTHDGRAAALFLTLAATSVGRGWDSVTHAAGGYRNRMRIEPAGD
jgi:hypothetical protein